MGFELAEQLGWKLPDAIFYPTGGGTGLIGMWKAFDELEAVGLIGPRAAADVWRSRRRAARRSSARSRAGDEFAERWEGAATIATGIRVPKAVGDFLILRAVRESGGAAIAVEEAGYPAGASRMPRATTACCSARKAARCWPAGGRRWSAGWSGRTSGCCCSIARTATNIRCPIGRVGSSWRGDGSDALAYEGAPPALMAGEAPYSRSSDLRLNADRLTSSAFRVITDTDLRIRSTSPQPACGGDVPTAVGRGRNSRAPRNGKPRQPKLAGSHASLPFRVLKHTATIDGNDGCSSGNRTRPSENCGWFGG